MATEIGDKTWEAFLDQHNSLLTLLDSHASLLAEMRKFCLDNSATMSLVQERLNTTESLIATFKLSTESLTDITKREEQVTKENAKGPEPETFNVPIPVTASKPKSNLAAEPLLDPSGFFAVDTNPTPIEQLYKKPIIAVKAKDGPKRKASGEQPPPNLVSDSERMRKKPKQGHEREETVPQEEDDSFLKKVEARSRAKEERKKARSDKKRKRQSGDSTGSAKGPKNKKQKQKQEPKLATAAPSAAPPAGTQVQNGKRPHTEPNNDGTNGRASKKKRRGSKN
ncbi:uncharacterized protein PV07_01034 [Cladophialophora immunda]|uniref:Uncharacterized protein n=1 Tax=Cladophialophora immunda TaxID=569365 RepID=A0A0D2A1I4_9EURO|nr:uncharacterized protein PV07_01034 [Cladophialophora immunda]KIW34241.1 hypothetical protein PV07_01034 [Cladophialophora immunda]OQU99068.1 hypothetical protein CLAIMM_04761 [Cladophialophora immunda]